MTDFAIFNRKAVLQALAKDWRSAGLQDGDFVLIHGSLSRTMKRLIARVLDATPDDVLESFLMSVDKKGTVMLPLWNFDFTKGVTFDIRTTPSKMGTLTEAGRLQPKAVRVMHLILAEFVIGSMHLSHRCHFAFRRFAESIENRESVVNHWS